MHYCFTLYFELSNKNKVYCLISVYSWLVMILKLDIFCAIMSSIEGVGEGRVWYQRRLIY